MAGACAQFCHRAIAVEAGEGLAGEARFMQGAVEPGLGVPVVGKARRGAKQGEALAALAAQAQNRLTGKGLVIKIVERVGNAHLGRPGWCAGTSRSALPN